MKQKKLTPDIDDSWKGLITAFFPSFIVFFLPDLYDMVDFSIPPEFLEQEFRNALRPLRLSKKGKKITDKLVKICMKDGSEKWILLHIEIQHTPEAQFGRRIFIYYTLISMRFPDKDIVTFVLFTGQNLPKDFNVYQRESFGTSMNFKFNSYAVINPTESDLLKSNNIFALAVLANQYLLKSDNTPELRLAYKKKVYEIAQEHLFSADEIEYFINFADELLILPDTEETDFQQYLLYNFNPKYNMETTYKRSNRISELFFKHDHDGMTSTEFADYHINLAAEKIKKANEELEEKEKETARKAEETARKAEETARKAEETARKAEETARKAEETARKAVLSLYFENNFNVETIAHILSLSTERVTEIIKQHQTENPPQ